MTGTKPGTIEKVDHRQRISETMATLLEQGIAAGAMPWNGISRDLLRPVNLATGRRYSGVNRFILGAAGLVRGFAEPTWATFSQWKEVGTTIRKGEKTTYICQYSLVDGGLRETETEQVFGPEQTGNLSHEVPRRKTVRVQWWPLLSSAQVEDWVGRPGGAVSGGENPRLFGGGGTRAA